VGVRLVLYRRTLLQAAHVDEDTAFQSAASFENTLSRLRESGVRVPWTVPTGHTHTTLLNVCSWVWSAGGDFITPDGKHVLFNQPAARMGLRDYFALGRFIPSEVRHLNALQPDEHFQADDQTAVTISGPWLFDMVKPALREQIGVAMPVGVPFLGGSHLVMWKHSHQHDAVMKLIHFLTETPAQVIYNQRIGLLPAVIEAFASPPFQTDRLWKRVVEGLKGGHTFSVTRSWGLMEDRLSTEFAALWGEVLSSPELDVDAAIARRLEPLARRLELVLGQT
jgi:multiple sugar transport system substrate-binding protein